MVGLELVKAQRRLLEPPASAQADPRQIAAFVDALWSGRGEVYPPTYVVIPARSAPAGAGRLTLVPSISWGVSYRLFQVQPPG